MSGQERAGPSCGNSVTASPAVYLGSEQCLRLLSSDRACGSQVRLPYRWEGDVGLARPGTDCSPVSGDALPPGAFRTAAFCPLSRQPFGHRGQQQVLVPQSPLPPAPHTTTHRGGSQRGPGGRGLGRNSGPSPKPSRERPGVLRMCLFCFKCPDKCCGILSLLFYFHIWS